MFSGIGKPGMRSAAWRVSLWATLAFACGTMIVFVFLHHFVAHNIQQSSDAWLSGEVEVLGDVAERTPKDALYGRVVKEVAELASREAPNRLRSSEGRNDSVFFLQTGADGAQRLWVGAGTPGPALKAISSRSSSPDVPFDLRMSGVVSPFRVATIRTDDGNHIYLGLSERDELHVLRGLRVRFLLLWLLIVLLGFAIVFSVTRRMLGHVRKITEAASRIGESDLKSRVPTVRRNDEVAHLALTLNGMLDRIENSIHQLHTITDSLAHDLRSPLTAIRGKLEMSLSLETREEKSESVVAAVDALDRLSEFLNKSLDVAEARADALRLKQTSLDLDELLRVMIDLYEPSMAEQGLRVQLRSRGPVTIMADAALIHRMVANLFDNELKHLPPSCTVTISLHAGSDEAMLVVEDDGPGFSPEVQRHVFERRTRGPNSNGHGLGLAFVGAVVHAHGGTVTAGNRDERGARLNILLPLAQDAKDKSAPAMLVAAG
jgi:signal transduction histidine kinase